MLFCLVGLIERFKLYYASFDFTKQYIHPTNKRIPITTHPIATGSIRLADFTEIIRFIGHYASTSL